MTARIVIVGAGHAAGQLIATLKQQKFAGQIVLVGEEPYLPYQRPPLSKKFLAGELPAKRLSFKPESFYADSRIEVKLATRVTEIDRSAKSVRTAADETIAYDTLVLAPGSRVRRLPIAGAALDGVHYLRNIEDVDAIRASAETHQRVVIVGAGYIGLEVAAVMRQSDHDVTVVEMADRVMNRVVSPEVSDFYQAEHTGHGVKLRLATGVAALWGNNRVESVETSDGEQIATDFVVIGAGIVPNTELAEHAGLTVNNGIVVDERCQSSDPNIYAVGDCTLHPNAVYDRQIRLESVHNALEQAKTAASNIGGKDARYAQLPWFWSDQYDLKLQIAGLSENYDEVVIRGDPATRSFACLYLQNGRLIATDAINAPRDFVQSKTLITARAVIDPAKLADTSLQLREMPG